MGMSSKSKYVVQAARAKMSTALDRERRARAAELRRVGEALATSAPTPYAGPPYLHDVAKGYRPALAEGESVPLVWWTTAENYGDLLSPWLVGKISQRPVRFADGGMNFCAVGSIASRANRQSVVWGSGLAGSENKWHVSTAREYHAVRGPLTRAFLRNLGAQCPAVYGDPALLAPLYFWPEVEKTHEVGIVVRWSEDRWRHVDVGDGVQLIDFGTGDVEGTTRALMSCQRIVSSSLHGLIVADAYGIPNAWMDSDAWVGGSRPAGGEFKFFDYMISVDKVRRTQVFDPLTEPLETDYLVDRLAFDDRPIRFDYNALLGACPFLLSR